MTNKQTIDGVPRELLQKIADGGYCHQGLMDRLRALLDAPTDPASALNRAWQAGYDTGYYAKNPAHERPAALSTSAEPKPRGEPVVWLDPQSGRKANTISATLKRYNEQKGGAPAAASALYTVPLYAHPPAPVAVVLPEEKVIPRAWGHDMGGNYEEGKAFGFNACLDEVTRLNTK